jgi:tetratricopeptide (TPR) repeat protein
MDEEKQYEQAEKCFKQGNTYYSQQEYEKAIESFNKAIELNPDYVEAYFCLGKIYSQWRYYDEHHEKTIESFNKAIELNPDYVEAYFCLGKAYYLKCEYDKAIESLNKAIELNPNYEDAYLYLGDVYNLKDEYDKAIEFFNKLIKLNPNHASSYDELGYIYHKKNEHAKAVKFFNKSIKLTNSIWAYLGLGKVYYDWGRYDMAIRVLKKAIKMDNRMMCTDNYLFDGLEMAYYGKNKHEIVENLNKVTAPEQDDTTASIKDQIIDCCYLANYFNRHHEKLNAFIQHVSEGIQMDKLRIMYLLIEYYMEFCGISLSYRTIVYNMGEIVFGEYVKEENSKFTGEEFFYEIRAIINPNYTSEYDKYDITYICKTKIVEYAMDLYEEINDSEMRAVLCYGLFRVMYSDF